MIYVKRNNQEFGPYDESTLLTYVNSGQILRSDSARNDATNEENTVKYFLKKAGLKPNVPHKGHLFHQLAMIGGELILPKSTIISKQWLSDKRLLLLALIGLFPTIFMAIPFPAMGIFYAIALYFSCIWGIFFYYFFRTKQVSLKYTLIVFFMTQLCIFFLWDIAGWTKLNPFYNLVNLPFPFNFIGYTLGVGTTEEFAKAIPLYILIARAKEPLIPQTLVFYGLMAGIAFGVYEGVGYQTSVNTQLDYTGAFFMNIARLTSLPFLHAIWCGIGGYFIAFANLYPKYRISLYFLSLAIPALLHGLYDTLCGYSVLIFIAVGICFIAVLLLMTYLKQGVNYQSKLRN